MTEGQILALQQLEDVERLGREAFEIVRVEEPKEAGTLVLHVSLLIGSVPRAEGGIPLRGRERFIIAVGTDFPFRPPSVWTPHSRFEGFPHVQWRRQICLYQAPSIEWDPSDGMFGFLVRLEEWLRLGAINQLDPIGGPVHPPAVYAEHDVLIIPRRDTPAVNDEPWFGLVQLREFGEQRLDIVDWQPLFDGVYAAPVAAGLLLTKALPWEYPKTVSALIEQLEHQGVSRPRLLLTLQVAVLQNPEDSPLYVVLGAPMRGTRGADRLQQHLSVWYIEPVVAKALRLAIKKYSEHVELQQIGEEVEAIVWKWAGDATLAWCVVREDRPEIVARRDQTSPVSWFRDKVVALWGCGALGSHIAEFLVRAGVGKLILVDNAKVAPGLLVRQQFDDRDLGHYKVVGLARRLREIREFLVECHTRDLISAFPPQNPGEEVDLVIESTGSRSLLKMVESQWTNVCRERTPFASMVVGPAAERGLVALVRPGHSGGPLDSVRRAKLSVAGDAAVQTFRNEFWPSMSDRRLFQPEPGCSDPTFVGSASDLSILAGSMLNAIARDLAQANTTASAHVLTRCDVPIPKHEAATASYGWLPDKRITDLLRNYDIRISEGAWKDILEVIQASRRRRGSSVETGGLLLGERDDAARVVWITEATPPPPDSTASRFGFICGTVGTAELDLRRRNETLGAVGFVGMWHTHPGAPPTPSDVDFRGMKQLVTSFDPPITQSLMLIVGHTPDHPTPAAYLFHRRDFTLGAEEEQVSEPPRGLWARGRAKVRLLQTREVVRRLSKRIYGGPG